MKALLIVDVQNDFCSDGALGVDNGERIVPVINRLTPEFDCVIQTQDWHPEGHWSFASSHKDQKAFSTVEMDYGTQVLWPDHCVQGSFGAEFHRDLNTQSTQLIIRKGFRREVDSYSAFYENDHESSTGLKGYLENRSVDQLYICGLATDFCVKWSVLDGLGQGFDVFVVKDAVAGIDLKGSEEKAWQEMQKAGAQQISSSRLINDNS